MPILNERTQHDFDPKNTSHLMALLCLKEGKQSALRFKLEYPYTNVVTMMNQKIIDYYLNSQLKGT